jgi:hypothetical protein
MESTIYMAEKNDGFRLCTSCSRPVMKRMAEGARITPPSVLPERIFRGSAVMVRVLAAAGQPRERRLLGINVRSTLSTLTVAVPMDNAWEEAAERHTSVRDGALKAARKIEKAAEAGTNAEAIPMVLRTTPVIPTAVMPTAIKTGIVTEIAIELSGRTRVPRRTTVRILSGAQSGIGATETNPVDETGLGTAAERSRRVALP